MNSKEHRVLDIFNVFKINAVGFLPMHLENTDSPVRNAIFGRFLYLCGKTLKKKSLQKLNQKYQKVLMIKKDVKLVKKESVESEKKF